MKTLRSLVLIASLLAAAAVEARTAFVDRTPDGASYGSNSNRPADPVIEAKLASTGAGARVVAPGYLTIDGRWYVFDRSANGSSGPRHLTLRPLDELGFFLHGFASASNCQSSSQPPQGGPRTSIGEQVGVETTGFASWTRPHDGRALIRIAHCQGINIIAVASALGNVVCSGPIPPPFNVQRCPALRNLDPRLPIFSSGFEG